MKTFLAAIFILALTGCAQTPMGRLNALNNQYNTKCNTTTLSGGTRTSMYEVCTKPSGDVKVNKVY